MEGIRAERGNDEHRGGPDLGIGNALEVLALAALIGFTIGTALIVDTGGHDATGSLEGRETVREDLRESLEVTEDWCCASDPSAHSRLHDASLQAWAGDAEAIEALLTPWFTDDVTQTVRLQELWQPHDEDASTPPIRLTTYGPRDPDGETVGVQRWTPLAERGPAHVVPRLNTTTDDAGLGVHHVPITPWWPYTEGPVEEHATWIGTELTYQASANESTSDYVVQREAHTELSGAPHPAAELNFKEPPWHQVDPEEGPSPEELPKEYRQVLTKDDLGKERAVEEMTGTDVYPHHEFQVDVRLHGPGSLGLYRSSQAAPGDQIIIPEAYQLEVEIPPEWTDVRFTRADWATNTEEESWHSLEETELPDGRHRLSAVLNLSATFDDAFDLERGDPPRAVLQENETVEASFQFHARPPDETEHDELGFHDITAHLEAVHTRQHETDRLAVEIPTDAGRVHRTVTTHTPTTVPPTETDLARVTFGATLLNGGEATTLEDVVWTAPEGTFVRGPTSDAEVRTTVGYPDHDDEDDEDDGLGGIGGGLDDPLGGGDTTEAGDADNWQVTRNGSRLEWTGGGSCASLEGCSVAANVTVNASHAPPSPPWKPPTLHALYQERDVQPYLDWFVRSDRAWDGVPPRDGPSAGFALAAEGAHAGGGQAPGAFLFEVPPTSSPVCSADEVDRRDRPQGATMRDGRRVPAFGPVEDGLPNVGERPLNDTCVPEDGFEPRFSLVAKNHDRADVDAVGRASYRSVDSLGHATVNEWRNGIAESRIEAPDTVRMGEPLNTTVHLDSLFETLQDQGIENATIRAEVYDPYNAWEGLPWLSDTLVSEGEIGMAEDPADPGMRDCAAPPCTSQAPSAGQGADAPSKLYVNTTIPDPIVPGTHLLVVEVEWVTEVVEDGVTETVRQTGSVVHPADVLLADGERASRTVTEGVAWKHDWR